ncbi:MAG TPA: UDP-2,3-diacylglucosamine diphosphatase LpxI [Limnochordales bacterium]
MSVLDESAHRSDPAGWVGVVAGDGELPGAMVQAALARGLGVVVVELDMGQPRRHGETSIGPSLEGRVHAYRLSPADWERVVETFCRHGVRAVYAAGKVNRVAASALFEQAAAGEGRALYEQGRFLEDQDLSRLFAEALERRGIRLGSQHELLGHLLAQPGVLTRRAPDARETADIEVGRRLAREVAALDIGQTVVVRHGTVLAVEASAEGTDATIRRAGRLAGPGSVVVKVSRPDQDLRFDTPVIGPDTLRAMRAARASCLAVEAHRCLLLHRERVVRAADRAGIAIVAF